MMNSIYKNQYVEIFIDLDRSLIFDTWTEASEDMEAIDFANFIDTWSATVVEHKIKFALMDTLCMRFTLVPEVQDIATIGMIKAVESGLTKQAMIVPKTEDLFTKVALDQTVDEMRQGAGFLVTEMFSSATEAEKWLFS